MGPNKIWIFKAHMLGNGDCSLVTNPEEKWDTSVQTLVTNQKHLGWALRRVPTLRQGMSPWCACDSVYTHSGATLNSVRFQTLVAETSLLDG
jgi:hypothetical protein